MGQERTSFPLQQVGGAWQFGNELVLEDFVWTHLESLFGLFPLKRQYGVNGEVCDILATNSQRQLVILELKNVEDRYVVQQLTRYYANLMEEKPPALEVDYSQPVQLRAIAPSFHRHNWLDKQFNTLNIQFWQFQVVPVAQGFALHLKDLDNGSVVQAAIPYQPPVLNVDEAIPEPPLQLLKWLGACTAIEQSGFLQVRSQLLAANERMKERVEPKSISYSSGKAKRCAEFCFERRMQKPVLFLWLPTPAPTMKPINGRLRIWTDGENVLYVGHVPEGLGKMRLEEEWQQIPKEKWPRQQLTNSMSYKSLIPVSAGSYMRKYCGNGCDGKLSTLVDYTIQQWQARC